MQVKIISRARVALNVETPITLSELPVSSRGTTDRVLHTESKRVMARGFPAIGKIKKKREPSGLHPWCAYKG